MHCRCGASSVSNPRLKNIYAIILRALLLTRSLHKIGFTRRVQRVVSFDESPHTLDDEVIALLQARVDTDGSLQIGEPLKRAATR